MRRQRRLAKGLVLLIIGVTGCLCLLLGSAIPAPALAQGHAGHTAQPPSAKEKPGAVKPQAAQPAPQEQVAEDAPQIEISPEQQQLIGVKTIRVSVRPIQKIIRTVGRVEADERKLATINTKIEGWIESFTSISRAVTSRKESPWRKFTARSCLRRNRNSSAR